MIGNIYKTTYEHVDGSLSIDHLMPLQEADKNRHPYLTYICLHLESGKFFKIQATSLEDVEKVA